MREFFVSAWAALGLYAGRVPRRLFLYTVLALGVCTLIVSTVLAPTGFSRGTLIEIPEDASFSEAAKLLEHERIVSSSFALRVLARITGEDTAMHAGRYLFSEPHSIFSVLHRLSAGEHGLPVTRITLPEGTSVREMGVILKAAIAGFNEEVWNAQASEYEGYLFPDTYDFFKDASVEEIIVRMRENFDSRTKNIQEEVALRGVPLEDIVTMASLIEKEANTEEDRHIVSGILWSRIEAGVALQVDAVFPYIRENPDHIPNGDDPEIDSPYNTYLNRGLPPGPIANPGLEALDSALNPTETDYFYYLTGRDGLMYYAVDFEGHKQNRERYLD